MARVVQRRTPPYLLIVFVILFVFATVIAVLFFNKFDTAEKKRKQLSRRVNALANAEQLNRPKIIAMVNDYKKSRGEGGIAPTVVAQLQEQVSKLAGAITGLPNTTYDEAQQEVEKTFREVDPPVRQGLVKHMTGFHEQLAVKETEIAKLQEEKQQLSQQLEQVTQRLADAKADFETKLQAKDEQLEALDKKFQIFETDQNAKLAAAKKEYLESVEQIKEQMTEQAKEMRKLERQLTKTERRLQMELDKRVRKPIDPERFVRRPDGKVSSVIQDEGLCYVNVGEEDRVIEGLRFAVYPYTGIPPSGGSKGVIEVVNVSDSVSECRIIEQQKDDPIVAGDVVANVVFDELRTYSFVVEGNFDINNTGEPTPAGNKAIKDLIRRYGGRIMKDVSIDTDYVILGDPPVRPRRPDDTDPQDAWDLYQERLQSFNRYETVKKKAEELQIPRLGGKRFLDLVGYVPTTVARTD